MCSNLKHWITKIHANYAIIRYVNNKQAQMIIERHAKIESSPQC